MRNRFFLAALASLTLLSALSARAQMDGDFSNGGAIRIGTSTTTCNAGATGGIRYNSLGGGRIEFCNGTSWVSMAQVQDASGPTAPPGSGYFVLTHTTWNGNLGGITGADAKCLTELGTTYTSWRGYATANANGQLTAAKVKAFLCDEYGCNHLMPLTTYYFAYANSGTPGGAGFTTDASGLGPNDNSNWSAANYFSGTYTYWMNREDLTSTKWGDVADWNSYNSCNSWVNGTTSDDGEIGSSSNTDGRRFWNSSAVCNTTRRLICFVNP